MLDLESNLICLDRPRSRRPSRPRAGGSRLGPFLAAFTHKGEIVTVPSVNESRISVLASASGAISRSLCYFFQSDCLLRSAAAVHALEGPRDSYPSVAALRSGKLGEPWCANSLSSCITTLACKISLLLTFKFFAANRPPCFHWHTVLG